MNNDSSVSSTLPSAIPAPAAQQPTPTTVDDVDLTDPDVNHADLSPAKSTPAVIKSGQATTTAQTTKPNSDSLTCNPTPNNPPNTTSMSTTLTIAHPNSKQLRVQSSDEHECGEGVRQAYVFLSECNRQDLRKIAKRWNCPQGFTKNILVAKLVIFIYQRVDCDRLCTVHDILGINPEWGFNRFLTQWDSLHKNKPVINIPTLRVLAENPLDHRNTERNVVTNKVVSKRKQTQSDKPLQPTQKRRVGRPCKGFAHPYAQSPIQTGLQSQSHTQTQPSRQVQTQTQAPTVGATPIQQDLQSQPTQLHHHTPNSHSQQIIIQAFAQQSLKQRQVSAQAPMGTNHGFVQNRLYANSLNNESNNDSKDDNSCKKGKVIKVEQVADNRNEAVKLASSTTNGSSVTRTTTNSEPPKSGVPSTGTIVTPPSLKGTKIDGMEADKARAGPLVKGPDNKRPRSPNLITAAAAAAATVAATAAHLNDNNMTCHNITSYNHSQQSSSMEQLNVRLTLLSNQVGSLVKAVNDGDATSNKGSTISSQFDTERSLLNQLKEAKVEILAAKSDTELQSRWMSYADRIRKALDDMTSSSR